MDDGLDELIYGRNVSRQIRPSATDAAESCDVVADGWSEDAIPKRPWLVPGFFLRGAVTVISGPPAAGKSSLAVAWAAAAALGRPFGRFRTWANRPLRVVSYNVEDDADEQRRRFSAIARQFGCNSAGFMGNLRLVTPRQVGTLLARGLGGGDLFPTAALARIEGLVEEFGADLLILDPFVELHDSDENDNTAIRCVMAHLRTLAARHQIGVGVLAHARKGAAVPGDPDAIRGASAIVGACRIAYTAAVMTEDEARSLGVPAQSRRAFFRLDGAKANYSALTDAEWFERIEFRLDNGDTVAVPMPWVPPSFAAGQETLAALADLVAKGSAVGPWSPRLSDDARSFRQALAGLGIEGAAAQKAALSSLVASRLVEVAEYRLPRRAASEPRQGLRTAAGEPRAYAWIDRADPIAAE